MSQASFINTQGGSGIVRSNELLKSACFANQDNEFVEERRPFFDDEDDDGTPKIS